ncbi:MAG TPA: SNF2-related protein, partial [Acidimicrobiales bacterium]
MIARTKRWDWFEVDLETGKPLAQVPGVRYVNGKFQLHRTHLPLLRGRNDELDACVDERLDGAGYEFVGDAARARAAGADLELRPWQAEALDWIAPRRGCLLADEMRLGKTLTALLSHDPDTGPLVILAPLDTRAVWLRWLAVVFPDVPVHVIEGKAVDPEAMREARIVFGHFDILTYHQSTVVQPGTLIVDEAHLLSNPRSKRSKSVLFYSGVAKRVILLSGTPMWNTSRGLWTLFAATGAGAWGKEFDFAQRYCSPEMTEYGWKYNGVSNRAEWHARRSECVLARTWREVRPDLPPPRRQTVAVPLDPDQRFEVDFAAAELMAGAKQLDVTVLARYR